VTNLITALKAATATWAIVRSPTSTPTAPGSWTRRTPSS